MNKLPRVVIVGRMNVGKSTIFNRLSVDVKSMTLDYEGVTRDFIKDVVEWQGHSFELVDTGGISLRKTQDVILKQVRKKALDLLKAADIVLMVVDGAVGVVPEDREIAQVCHTTGKKVLLVVNKTDTPAYQEHKYDFERLGFTNIVPMSATHGHGAGDLLELIVKELPTDTQKESEVESYKVVLLGKPNVGKSSLMNKLVAQERSIVTDVAGTTREAISENIQFYQEDIELTDTAGVRKKSSVNDRIETMMVKSSFRALEHANIVLLLVDASSGTLSDQELKLAFYAFEHFKALIILFNKQDLVTQESTADMATRMDYYQHFIDRVEHLSISCKTDRNIGKILPLVKKVWERYKQKFSDDELTILFKQALVRRPLYHTGKQLNVFKVRQVATAPISLVLVVNEPDWFGPSQLAFFDHVMREAYDLKGVPVKMMVRKRS
jgi:GTP-binding protein